LREILNSHKLSDWGGNIVTFDTPAIIIIIVIIIIVPGFEYDIKKTGTPHYTKNLWGNAYDTAGL
jgi:hypothetical protein